MAVQESLHARHILQTRALRHLQPYKLERRRSHTKLLFPDGEAIRGLEHLSRFQGGAVSPDKNKHVVIVGGGFAGVSCAHKLARTPDLQITLIDKNNYHQFQPLLYQVATAELGPGDVAFMLRKTLKE